MHTKEREKATVGGKWCQVLGSEIESVEKHRDSVHNGRPAAIQATFPRL